MRPPKRGTLETERGTLTGRGSLGGGTAGRGGLGVAWQRAVSTAGLKQLNRRGDRDDATTRGRVGYGWRGGSDGWIGSGGDGKRPLLKGGEEPNRDGQRLKRGTFATLESFVCLEADADSLLLHFEEAVEEALGPLALGGLAPPGVAKGSPFQGTPRAVSAQ